MTQNLGAHTASAVNNAGQIVGGSEIYANGVWKTLPNFPGGANGISDNGKISYYISQTYSSMYGLQTSVTAGVYALATVATIQYIYGTGNQYVPPPGLGAVNREGDVIGSMSSSSGTSKIQHLGFGYVRGQRVQFGGFVNYPTIPLNSGGITALNNNGDLLAYYGDSNYGGAGILYNADSAQQLSVTQFIVGSNSSVAYGADRINDRREFIVESGYPTVYYIATPNGSVSGSVALDHIAANAPVQNITFEFRNALDTSLFTVTANVGPDGAYTIPNIATGVYHIRVKGDKYLAQMITVNSGGGAVTGANVTLPGGDASNDNSVDIADFGILLNAYGSLQSDPTSGYDATADFNGDGSVDTLDFGILVNNYGRTGTP